MEEYIYIGEIAGYKIQYHELYKYSIWKGWKCLEDRMTLKSALDFIREEAELPE